MAASPTVRADLTPDDASVLCMLCTGAATGARLVATVNLRMSSSLADVRAVLESLAHGGDGGAAAVNEEPTNVSAAQAEAILNAPLHPFDFTGPFCFVHGGGNRAYSRATETALQVKDALPRYPRLGAPASPEWALSPPAPTVVVPLLPAYDRPGRRRRRERQRGQPSSSSGSAAAAVGAAAFTATQKRLALCILYVAQGRGQEGSIQLERILAERLILQQTVPPASSSSSATASSSAVPAKYGRSYELKQWCATVTRWNANVPDLLGRTILQEMASEGNDAVVKYLVSQPFVRLNEADRQGNTALHLAVVKDRLVSARFLVEAGADPLESNREGNTPLHLALLYKRAALVGLLCGKLRATGVDVPTTLRGKRNSEGLSPVDLFEKLSPTFLELCFDGTLLAVESLTNHYLFDKAHLTARELGTRRSGLHAAAMNEDHKDVVPYLVAELGPSLFPAKRWRDLLDYRLQTPLHLAAAHGCLANAQALLHAYPDFLSQQDINGDTPLMSAIKHRQRGLAEMLLTHSPPGAVAPGAYDRHGMTALHLACGLGWRGVAEALLTQHGASAVSDSAANLLLCSEGSIWDAAEGGRNVTLVPSSVNRETLSVALQMQKATGGRRRERAPKCVAAPAAIDPLSPSLLSPQFGGGRRGSTPLLCALVATHQRFERRADVGPALDLVDLLLSCGGLASAEDARDALVLLLSHDCVALADRILSLETMGGSSSALAAVVRAVRSDNKLLCRLCERVCSSKDGGVQAHSIEPVRWCVERRCCADVNQGDSGGNSSDADPCPGYLHDGGLPLLTCARVGNVAATRFLLEVAGADPNVVASSSSSSAAAGMTPLLAAIHGGHGEVAGLLIRAGARVSAADGSWSALAAAAVRGLDAVVRGLMGLEALNPFDIPHALLEVLLADVNAVEGDTQGNGSGIYSINAVRRRPQSLRGAREARRRERCRLCESLAKYMDPTASTLIHPVELLHLSASRGFFTVTRILVERLLMLPHSTLVELVLSAPQPPSERPTTLVEPTMAPIERCPWKRLLPNPRTGKGGLHRMPRPFLRLVVPNYRHSRLQRVLPHRVVQRDVFSYIAAAASLSSSSSPPPSGAPSSATLLELARMLRYDVGLHPWTVVDVCGCTPADYAIRAGNKALLCFFAASGIAPHGRRSAVDFRGVRSAANAKGRASVRPICPLVRAVYHGQEYHGDAAQLTAAAMRSLVQERTDKEDLYEASQCLCALIEERCRQQQQHGGADLSHAGAWMDTVVYTCAAANRLDVLQLLKEEYRYRFSRAASPLPPPPPSSSPSPTTTTTPLLVAVAENNVPLVSFLLHAGCDAHEAGLPRHDMVPYMKVKRAADVLVTPLCLAAWMGRYEVVRLLTSAAPFEPTYFAEVKRRNAEGTGRVVVFDALSALIRAAPRGLPEPQEALLAVTVRNLADAAHPFLSPLALREAAEKRLLHTVDAIVECYGPSTFLADITDANSVGQVNSLHHFAAHPRLCGLLRSLLVLTESDEYGVASRKPTDVAKAVVQLYGGNAGSREAKQEARNAGGDALDGPPVMGPVDWALSRNCADGAVLLLAVGLLGTGRTQCVGKPSILLTQVQTALQHYHRTSARFMSGTFTVLHSAVMCGLDAVLDALSAEMTTLAPVSDVLLAPGMRVVTEMAMSSQATMAVDGEGRRLAPSLYALAARDASGWRRWLPKLEAVVRGDVPLAASDIFTVIFAGLGVTRTLDALLRMPCNAKVFVSSFTLHDPDVDSATLAKALRSPSGGQSRLFVDGGRAMLTGFTPLTCAVAAGSLEWVQYFTSANPSAIVYHRATATRLRCARDRAEQDFDVKRSRQASRSERKKKRLHPSHTRHHCALDTRCGLTLALTDTSTGMDALVLSAAALADAVASRSVARITQHAQIFDFLVRVPGALRKENVNAVAMTAAALHRWPMLEAVMEQALHMREAPAGDRFFFTLLPEEVPLALRRVIGAARHVMHLAARGATQDVIIRVARHSSRSDVESGCDGNGNTSLYHALRHRSSPVPTLATFASLRIPMGAPCCRRSERTPLMVAASDGAVELVSRLLKADRVNQQDRHGHTALMLAAARGHLAVVELLLASNADARLTNRAGMTAAMLAARSGHDDVAAPMAQHFSRVKDFATAQTTLLHCAAVGGCWRTAEIVCKAMQGSTASSGLSLMREDADGHTALYLAHCFGSARVLRTIIAAYYESRREGPAAPLDSLGLRRDTASDGVAAHARMMLLASNRENISPCPKADPSPATLAGQLGEAEKRILRCDSSLVAYGWLKGVLTINATLAREAQKSATATLGDAQVPLRPGEKAIAPCLPPFRTCGVSRPFEGTLLHWCAIVNNAVGIRALADMNVADDCGALHVAARFGHVDSVKLLVSLDMSDPNLADEERGLFPFESAAVAGHAACASYLLQHTSADAVAAAAIVAVPVPSIKKLYQDTYGADEGGAGEGTRYPHGMLHRLAPACGGAILVQAVDLMMRSSNKVGALCEKLWMLLQRPDEVGLTPFEYTIAMGDPCAVLRCAQLLQQLAEEARRARSPGGYAELDDMESVTIARSLLEYLPNLSPPVRALLFDVFSVDGVSHAVGFDPDPADAAAVAERRKRLKRQQQQQQAAAAEAGEVFNGSAQAVGVATNGGPSEGEEDAVVRQQTHRLTFADVRLLGINALTRDDYCQSLVSAVYTVDHERLALRFLMKDFPYRIRYEPEAFRGRTLAQQKQLLQWLSTSLILSPYEHAKPGDIDSIEVKVAPHRSDELYVVQGTESATLVHSIYVSTSHYLVGPDVHAALKSTREAYRSEIQRELGKLCRRATTAMRRLPHPALRKGTVTLDWDVGGIGLSASSTGSAQDVHADRERWDSVVRRLRTALEQMALFFSTRVGDLLRDVNEDDLVAVVSETRKPQPAAVWLRYSNDPSSSSSSGGSAVTRFPPVPLLGGGEDGMQCSLLFDRQTMIDAVYGLEHTIYQAVAADVALVRVHYTRDRFLRRLRAALKRPMEREAAVTSTAHAERPPLLITEGDATSSPPTSTAVVATATTGGTSSSTAQASLLASLSSVKFKLELENSSIAAIPVGMMCTMLEDAADVVERLLAADTALSSPPTTSADVRRFHSTSIIAEAVGRKLRTVLVLFSTKREPLVKFNGDKLMLCFTPQLAPNAADIACEIKKSIITEETAVCRRLLTDIVGTLAQKLQSYMPGTRLVVDLAAIDGPAEDTESVLSSLRLLTYKYSSLVLEPFIDGVCVGWDGPVGACVRRVVKQLTLTLETGERGTCYLTPRGNCVYYCPLQCVQRGGPGVRGSLATLSAWQLLTSQQVASLVLLQLAVTQPELSSLVERRKSVACWSSVNRDGTRPVVAGGHGYAHIQLRNILNQVVRKPETVEQFKFVGNVDKVRVKEQGGGRYRVRFTAPHRAGYTNLHALLHGQQLLYSPLHLRVRPGNVSLARTTTLSDFDAVVASRPFEVLLRLADGFGNRLDRPPTDMAVRLKHGSDLDAEVLSWRMKGPDTVVVELTAKRAKPEVLLHLLLSCTVPVRKRKEDDALQQPPTRAVEPLEYTHSLVYQCVDATTYARVLALRKGVVVDASGRKADGHAKLFFRSAVREAEAARVAREAESIGAAAGRRFAPPPERRTPPKKGKKNAGGKKARRRAKAEQGTEGGAGLQV